MSRAVKCNRCHKCFDPLDMKDGEYICTFDNPIYANREDYKNGKITDYLFNGESRLKIDLCPHCAEEYRLFMEGCNLAVHDNDFDKPDVEPSITKDLNEMFANAIERINKFGRDMGFKE